MMTTAALTRINDNKRGPTIKGKIAYSAVPYYNRRLDKRMENEVANDKLRERLEALAAFLPRFEAPDFAFGAWRGGEETKPGVRTMPYFDLSPTALAFVRTAYEQSWVVGGWDWPAWTKTQEAIALRDDREALAAAEPGQLAKILTVLIRQDRFVEGALNGAYESGLLTAIVRRAAALSADD